MKHISTKKGRMNQTGKKRERNKIKGEETNKQGKKERIKNDE